MKSILLGFTRGEEKIVTKTYDGNLRLPEFRQRLEEAKVIVEENKPGNRRKAAHHILSVMNLTKDENNPSLLPYIPDRQLSAMLGIGRSQVWRVRSSLSKRRYGADKNNQRGCVYILTNPSMPGLIKIGKTTGTAQERADELYTTGVPVPFSVDYWIPCEEPELFEFILHTVFRKQRINKNREFFRCSTDEVLEWFKEQHALGRFLDVEILK